MALTLIIGGARSGKSDLALRLATASARPVLFVATMEPGDDEMRRRIAAHRAERPQAWRTVEAPLDVVGALVRSARDDDFVVLDCLTLWVANLMLGEVGDIEQIAPAGADGAMERIAAETRALADWCDAYAGEIAVVTNEVGLGVVPAYATGRMYRDALGTANAAIATRANRVFSVAAGLVVDLTALGAQPLAHFGPKARS